MIVKCLRGLMQCLGWVWASPNTLLGLAIGCPALLAGGRVKWQGRALEFHGGFIPRLLGWQPLQALALTLGHVIIGQDDYWLGRCRNHEWVHVRQYEIFGPFFLPFYFGCSAALWLMGKDPYRDNPFEKQAYSIASV